MKRPHTNVTGLIAKGSGISLRGKDGHTSRTLAILTQIQCRKEEEMDAQEETPFIHGRMPV